MAYKVFSNGDALTGGELNTFLMNQSVITFASVAARNAALPAPLEGQLVWLEDSNKYVYYTGSAWTDLLVPASSGNAIINGAMEIWQRGTSFSGSNDVNVWTADRFRAFIGAGGSLTASQQAFTPGTAPVAGYEGATFLRVAKTAVNTGFTLDHFIEDVRTFAGQTVTFSFFAKAAAGVTITPKFWQGFGSGGSSSVITNSSPVTLTTSWARYTITFAVPSVSGKTIGASSFLAIRIWDFTDSAAHTIDLWGVQLEAGTTATTFRRNGANIGEELASCQRYFQQWDAAANSFTVLLAGFAETSSIIKGTYPLQVLMRVGPTITISGSYQDFGGNGVTVTSDLNLPYLVLLRGTASGSPFTAWQGRGIRANNDLTARILFSAEL